jgi:ABC-type antimicrobial peptide transport system permease subunit
MALVYGVIGTFFGLLLSIPATAAMAGGLAEVAETYIDGFKLSARGLGIGAAMGLAVPVAVAALPVFNGTRTTIREAITDLGISSKWGTGPLARMIGRLPIPITVRQGLSNIIQKRGRLILTIIALTFAAGSFMGVQASYSSLSGLTDKIFGQFKYDIQFWPETPHSLEEMRQALAAQGVEYAQLYQGFSVNVGLEGYQTPGSPTESNQIEVTGIDPDHSALRLDLREGDGWQKGVSCTGETINMTECQSVILSRTLAEILDKHPGDSVVVTGGGQSFELKVVGVDNLPYDTLYLRWDALATLAGYVDTNGVPYPNVFFVKMNTADPSIDETSGKIKEIADALLASNIHAGLDNRAESEADEMQGIDLFGLVFNITSAVFAAVGGIGLLAVLSMSVLERQKEIGVIRSIGGQSSAIVSQFLTEGILVGVIAWLLGVPLSYLLATVLIEAMPFSTTIDFHYPLMTPVIGLFGVVVFAAVASLWPSISASRKTVSDILRYS